MSEQALPTVHWSLEPQGMVQTNGGFVPVPICLHKPPEPPPQFESIVQDVELNKSSNASQVVSVWLMPQ